MPRTNSKLPKGKGRLIFEHIAFILCLCVIALRTTFTEGLNAQSLSQPANLIDSVYSLSISAVLILMFAFWFILAGFSRKFSYRFTGIEIGLCIFTTAAVIAGLAASNKRAAITDFATLLAPILMAVLLVQILDSQSKIKLLLAVIAALGVVSAWQCSEQLFAGNQSMIEQYEQSPQTMLEPLGIQPGSFQQFLFEHRLYSRVVCGFFTTSNSAGSFALLASFAAIALFLDKFRNRKASSSGTVPLVACGIAAAAVLAGLAITQSKGAIAASIIAAAMFITYLLFGSRLKKYKKAALIFCLLFFIAAGCAVVSYGLAHGRLPGGNSMLVRWQYWRGAAEMYADHPLTGIGPGNFGNLYPRYKPDAAPEAVVDPHNFLLSILTQYGPLGLVGFIAMIFVPLWRVCFTSDTSSSFQQKSAPTKRAVLASLGAASAVMLLVRPIILPMPSCDTIEVTTYVMFSLYVVPAVMFAVGLLLLTAIGKPVEASHTNVTAAILFCACVGVIVHNLIDFAIFEPGVSTAFWAVAACLITLNLHQKAQPPFVVKPAPFAGILVVAGGTAVIWIYFNYAVVPVVSSTAKICQAGQAGLEGKFDQAHHLLDIAAEDDRLSSAALSFNGILYLQEFHSSLLQQKQLLLESEKCLLRAIKRSRADFKNFERLTEVYTLLAEISTQQEKPVWLNKAFDTALLTVERYPGSDRLQLELARIAEQLGKTDIAIERYKRAVNIEDSFRSQFKIMYPDREIFSRLGEEKYQFATERMKVLKKQQKQD